MSDPDQTALERRLEAVEAAISADETTPAVADSSSDTDVSTRLDALETRVEELDAALQAVRGFLGGVDAVNESVESRADAAIAAVERLERQLDGGETTLESHSHEAEHASPTTAEAGPGETQAQTLPERLRDQW